MGEQNSVASLSNLPYEIKVHVLDYVELHFITRSVQKLSVSWKRLCRAEMSSRLTKAHDTLIHCLTRHHSTSTMFDSLSSTLVHAKLLTNLGSGRHEPASLSLSCIDLQCAGFDVSSATIIFHPSGSMISLGLWIQKVGFLPIVPPESGQSLSFPSDHPPWLYFAFRVERPTVCSTLQVKEDNADSVHVLPRTPSQLENKVGEYQIHLRNELHGVIGAIKYRIDSVQSALPDEPVTTQEILAVKSSSPRRHLIYPNIVTGTVVSVRVRADYFFELI